MAQVSGPSLSLQHSHQSSLDRLSSIMAKGGSLALLAMLAVAAYVTSPSFVGGGVKAPVSKAARRSLAGWQELPTAAAGFGVYDGVKDCSPTEPDASKAAEVTEAFVMVTCYSTGNRVRINIPVSATVGTLKKQAIAEMGYAQPCIAESQFSISQSKKPVKEDYFPEDKTLKDYGASRSSEFYLW